VYDWILCKATGNVRITEAVMLYTEGSVKMLMNIKHTSGVV